MVVDYTCDSEEDGVLSSVLSRTHSFEIKIHISDKELKIRS